MSILEKPLSTARAYVDFLSARELPVLRQTARRLDTLRALQDEIGTRELAAVVLADPLFAVRLLLWLDQHRGRLRNHDLTTPERAVMMMGIGPFFSAFENLPTVEDRLADRPEAMLRALQTVAWIRRATRLGRDWAVLRRDIDPDEVALATLLRPVVEVLLWVFAPTLAQRIVDERRTQPELSPAAGEHLVLGCSERDIRLGLAHAWHLPELLVTLMDEANGGNPRAHNVTLAIQFARGFAEIGWDAPAVRAAIHDLLHLLPVGREPLLEHLGVPAEVAERWQADGPD